MIWYTYCCFATHLWIHGMFVCMYICVFMIWYIYCCFVTHLWIHGMFVCIYICVFMIWYTYCCFVTHLWIHGMFVCMYICVFMIWYTYCCFVTHLWIHGMFVCIYICVCVCVCECVCVCVSTSFICYNLYITWKVQIKQVSQSTFVLRWAWWWEGSLVSCCQCFAGWLWLTGRRYPDLLWHYLLPVPIHQFVSVNHTSPFYVTYSLSYSLLNTFGSQTKCYDCKLVSHLQQPKLPSLPVDPTACRSVPL